MLIKRGRLSLIIITFNNETMRLPLILKDSLSLLSVHVLRASFQVESCALIYRVCAVCRSLATNKMTRSVFVERAKDERDLCILIDLPSDNYSNWSGNYH